MARHQVGDIVRVWNPGHAEHGLQGVVYEVKSIEQYYRMDTEEGRAFYGADTLTPCDQARGPHAYRSSHGWRDAQGRKVFGGTLPDAMVVSEATYRLELGH